MILSISIIVAILIIFLAMTNINTIGLNILSKIKKLSGNAVNIQDMKTSELSEISHAIWNNLLLEHVTPEGRVNYNGIQNNSVALTNYLELLSKNPPSTTWSENESLAYWVNAYNAFTVQLILDNYPLKSIKDISSGLAMINSSWDIKFFKIGGVDFDLSTIEHEILRKKFNEPRIHFAINCASLSCPRLRNEAFTATKLEDQLKDQTTGFFADTSKNIITQNENSISSIMNWFEADFTKNQTLGEFIKTYNNTFDPDNKINFLDYDWALNN